MPSPTPTPPGTPTQVFVRFVGERPEVVECQIGQEMKPILNLTIKRNWLAMIACGIKKEEYRAPNCAQLRNWRKKRMRFFYRYEMPRTPAIFRAGYAMDSMACVVDVLGVAPPVVTGHGVFAIEDPNFWKEPRHPEWGEPPLPHYTILLGEVLKSDSYEACKRFVEELK